MYNSVTIRSFVPRLGFVLDITFTSSFFFYEGVRSLLLTTRIVIVTVEREGGGDLDLNLDTLCHSLY